MSKRTVVTFFVILLAAFVIAGEAEAQVAGTISGYVRDESGAVIPGADVTATRAATIWLLTRLLTNMPRARNIAPANAKPRYDVTTGQGSMPLVRVHHSQSSSTGR